MFRKYRQLLHGGIVIGDPVEGALILALTSLVVLISLSASGHTVFASAFTLVSSLVA